MDDDDFTEACEECGVLLEEDTTYERAGLVLCHEHSLAYCVVCEQPAVVHDGNQGFCGDHAVVGFSAFLAIPELVDIIHTVPRCGQVAFRTTERPRSGDPMLSEKVRLIDGSQPRPGDRIACGSCRQLIPVHTSGILAPEGGWA